jgi:hypothetical protein
MKHILKNFPLCPSANKQHFISRGRLIKSSLARAFDKQVEIYIAINRKTLEDLKTDLNSIISQGMLLRVDTYFCFDESSLLTKKNTIKVIDTNNRIKATLDAVSKAIGIDDKYFVSGYSEKVIRCKLSKENHSLIIISPALSLQSEEIIQQSLTTLPK